MSFSILDDMPHRCTIERHIRTPDSLGGFKESTVVEQTGVACWQQVSRHSSLERSQMTNIVVMHKIYFKTDPDVNSRSIIKITSLDKGVTTISDPYPLEVESEARPDASAGLGVVYKVMTIERRHTTLPQGDTPAQ